MDSIMTAGTRDLALSGSFVVPVAVARPRVEHEIGATVLFHITSLIGADVPVIDRMRMSAAEP